MSAFALRYTCSLCFSRPSARSNRKTCQNIEYAPHIDDLTNALVVHQYVVQMHVGICITMAASSVYNVQRMDYGYSTFIDVKGLRVGELVRLTANMSRINEDF